MVITNWNLAPEGAETLRQVKKFGYLRWFNSEGQAWYGKEWDFPVDEYETVATRPTQTKTVADAVEWANGEWIGDSRFIVYQEELGKFAFVVSEKPYMNGWGLVCTREEFEAYVKEQELKQPTQNYTHIYKHNCQLCYIIAEHGDKAWVMQSNGEYLVLSKSSLIPNNIRLTKEAVAVLDDFKGYASSINGIGVNNLVELYLKDRFNTVSENK